MATRFPAWNSASEDLLSLRYTNRHFAIHVTGGNWTPGYAKSQMSTCGLVSSRLVKLMDVVASYYMFLLSMQLIFPVGGLYTVSKHQSLGGPDLQAFRSRWPDLSGFWIADVQNELLEDVATAGAVTANVAASTEDIRPSAITSDILMNRHLC